MTTSTGLGTSLTYVAVVVEAAVVGDAVPIRIKEEAEAMVAISEEAAVVVAEAEAEDVAVLEEVLLIQPTLAETTHLLNGDL